MLEEDPQKDVSVISQKIKKQPANTLILQIESNLQAIQSTKKASSFDGLIKNTFYCILLIHTQYFYNNYVPVTSMYKASTRAII